MCEAGGMEPGTLTEGQAIDCLERGAIYVDDSGNPGVDSGSDFLPSSRKSWTAVVVPSSIAQSVATGMRIFLAGVLADYGAEELHFTDIWSGVGPWKGIKPAERAKVIGIMTDLMEAYSLPVIHQTVSDYTLADHPDFKVSLEGERAGDWKLDRLDHFGLLLLCSQVSRHILELMSAGPADFDLPLPLIVDEGVLAAGRERTLPNWGAVIEGPKACFRSSSDLPGLQLADFAAFVITRSQWQVVKRNVLPAFEEGEAVILRAASVLNILNLPARTTNSGELGRTSYESWMEEDREAKGLSRRPPDRG